ncbi:hypothetical protein CPB83DRAFT_66835 [Crepidotus variabilis]|uniref:Tetratricopeptide repeat protein n=1 Tax=Crepidotus variabilis TaxID=179855 RepID=A0A9P6E5T3_9AGAR|nr:hypothetical protein CPB83DRAFT_66835 [Crepidotus variabilis]
MIHRSELNEIESQHCRLKRGIVLAYLTCAYPDTHLDIKFAEYLLEIGQYLPDEIMSTDQNLLFLEESVIIFRKASRFDPASFADPRFRSFKELALHLESLEKREEAHAIWQEATNIDPSLVRSHSSVAYALFKAADILRAISRYEEAAALRIREIDLYHSPNEYSASEADAYLELAADYRSCRRLYDALRSISVAVNQLRELVLIELAIYSHFLADALSSYFQLLVESESSADKEIINPQVVKGVADQYDTLIQCDTSFLPIIGIQSQPLSLSRQAQKLLHC